MQPIRDVLTRQLDAASANNQPSTILINATPNQADSTVDIFVLNADGDLTIKDLNLEGGYRGFSLDVPAGDIGMVTVNLTDVSVTGTFNNGVHVDDQTSGSEGSDASVVLNLTDLLHRQQECAC